MAREPLKLKLKIISGNKDVAERQYNEFAQDNKIQFQQGAVTGFGEGTYPLYTIFVYYE